MAPVDQDGSRTVDDSDTANTLNNFLVVFLHTSNLEMYCHEIFGPGT